MLMQPIVSVNQLSIYRAVLIWYLVNRCEVDNISANADHNMSEELVTKLT